MSFKYERLPLFCHCYRLLRHDLKHCAKFFTLRKNSNEVICQYRDWLKFSGGGRNQSPPRKALADPRQQTSESDGERVDSFGRHGEDRGVH